MSLFEQIQQTTTRAKELGALLSLTTAQEIVVDQDIPFVVRILAKLEKKETYQKKQVKKKVNPFLPYEKDLFVADLSAHHVCLLNKFNVVDHHILIITRDFQSQEHWITQPDFEALATCMGELDGLAFYNAGKAAGASQPHKHLQLIPFSGALNQFSVPIETAIAALDFPESQPTSLNIFPFHHGIAPIPTNYDGQTLFEIYKSLLEYLNFIDQPLAPGQQTQPYNLLATRRWMMLIHRTQDCYQQISINSLGFAGALLVRDRHQLEFLKKITPIQLLAQVTQPQ
ncbi:ATP adenylyltransferase family protein [[Limnothrix rosea] IAM M-220]|uniref:ATP adenylyltransferase family protein n=1 Tax=[Limnothrix rosea] IAM M-220 TaxID=454133 RepID=UPI0009667F4E|nr:Ap4A phosphorylase II [[Limnothrix rosea] IAM M-220]OKH16066.1 Ap4A phosphorylase II [[Limnothrix rosea] IAM M-220]